MPHLVQSRWVCASLQQQAHDLGLVLLRRHVKGRLPILHVGEERGRENGERRGNQQKENKYWKGRGK
jgi:hypothetical protein